MIDSLHQMFFVSLSLCLFCYNKYYINKCEWKTSVIMLERYTLTFSLNIFSKYNFWTYCCTKLRFIHISASKLSINVHLCILIQHETYFYRFFEINILNWCRHQCLLCLLFRDTICTASRTTFGILDGSLNITISHSVAKFLFRLVTAQIVFRNVSAVNRIPQTMSCPELDIVIFNNLAGISNVTLLVVAIVCFRTKNLEHWCLHQSQTYFCLPKIANKRVFYWIKTQGYTFFRRFGYLMSHWNVSKKIIIRNINNLERINCHKIKHPIATQYWRCNYFA